MSMTKRIRHTAVDKMKANNKDKMKGRRNKWKKDGAIVVVKHIH